MLKESEVLEHQQGIGGEKGSQDIVIRRESNQSLQERVDGEKLSKSEYSEC